jgi:carbon-monoxide dehydrogenase large subunit
VTIATLPSRKPIDALPSRFAPSSYGLRRGARGELVGIGVATFVEPGGGWESGSVFVDLSGQVIAHTGATPHRPGPPDDLRADRRRPTGRADRARHGARQRHGGGPDRLGHRRQPQPDDGRQRAGAAADEVLAKACRVAAHLREAAPEDVRVADGRFSVAGLPERSVDWPAVAQAAYLRPPPGERPGLDATTAYQGPEEVYGYGCYASIVHIDRDTGTVRVERVVAVDDGGVIVNPLLVEGQVMGGIAQGLGQALCEEVRFGASGQLATGTLLDYAVPVTASIPPVELRHIETPSPRNPLGVKGVGEAGAIGVPAAVANAVVDALRPLGITHLDVPLTAEKVWRAMRERG